MIIPEFSGVYKVMKNIIYPHVGNATQAGINLALRQEMNLKDSIREAQTLFRCSTRNLRIKKADNWQEQIESAVKRGFYEFSKLGTLKNYQRRQKIDDLKLNHIGKNKWSISKKSKKSRDIRFDFEFNKPKNILLELKVVWKVPKKISNRTQKQLITYSKNSTKKCIVCFLVIKKLGRAGRFVNTIPYFFELNLKKPK